MFHKLNEVSARGSRFFLNKVTFNLPLQSNTIMITNENFIKYPLQFPETAPATQFEIISFKVKNKIFVTHNIKESRCCIKLSEVEQTLFCMIDKTSFFLFLISGVNMGGLW